MTRILSSIDGRKSGGTQDVKRGSALQPGPQMSVGGFLSGDHGSQIHLPAPSRVTEFDDFLGAAVLPVRYTSLEGTDSATSAAVISGVVSGALRLTTGDAGTGIAADGEMIVETLQWRAANGELCGEWRVKMSAITTCWAFIGFTDQISTLEAAIESAASGNTITTNASDAVGFMFDTRMTDDNWWLVGVAADVDATAQDSDIAPTAAQYQTLRVEVTADGIASFFINGQPVGTRMTGAVTAATQLTPTIGVSKTSVAASMTMDVDYQHVSMLRGADGTAF
jgi:hypothetical protein